MTDYWNGLTERERLVLLAGGGFLAIGLFFLMLWSPLMEWRESARQNIVRSEGDFRLIQQAASQGPASSQGGNVDTSTPIRNVISATAKQIGFPLTSYNPLPDGSVTASASGATPDKLFEWVLELERRYAITVLSADIARESDNPDMVRVQMTLGRQG